MASKLKGPWGFAKPLKIHYRAVTTRLLEPCKCLMSAGAAISWGRCVTVRSAATLKRHCDPNVPLRPGPPWPGSPARACTVDIAPRAASSARPASSPRLAWHVNTHELHPHEALMNNPNIICSI